MKTEVVFSMVSAITILLLISSFSNAQSDGSPSLSPLPTPEPEIEVPDREFVNLADLFNLAGPFSTILKYAESTKVLKTFQDQANSTQEGITIFVPKDQAFSALKNPSLKNLTHQNLKSLILFHALPKYYSLADFNGLSKTNPVATFAGAKYSLNFTYVSGTISIDSGWTQTKISSSVHSTDPVAVYQVDKVLLPEALFGVAPPPPPATAPSPDSAAVPGPADDEKSSTKRSSSPRSLGMLDIAWVVCATSLWFLRVL